MDPKKKKSSIGTWLASLGILLITFGSKLKVLFPLLKVGKFLPTFLTMILSIWAYTLIAPFQVAFGLVMMILIHEIGHVLAAKQRGLPVSAPAFIPFVGAFITMKKQPRDAETEAFIALGGPLLGTVGALGCWILGYVTGDSFYYMIAYIGFFLNVFNLVPIHPLDGGRIVVAISRWFWVLGLIMGLVLIIYLRSILLSIIYVMFVYQLYAKYVRKKKPKKQERSRIEILSVKLDPHRFAEVGAYIPSELHRRELDYRYYTVLASKRAFLDVFYPGLGRIATIPDLHAEIKRVYLIRTQMTDDGKVEFAIEMEYRPFYQDNQANSPEDKRYYDVSKKHRLLYGVSYLGLATLLLYMMWITQTMVPEVR
ncbi:Zn-dependent protease (includes SpoIVFB) [Thermoactinomyces sp. DSM 45891]|uniref:site-2 protease family protein n=1 Tax=Thermoactinomyces sp. DSM 45891 TaxID=1761907 RepID=UPI000912594E|nr:site-2 protease family protein [Thermoactinomyces sp. DSM 45891]SFX39445.1 Zn-dependent protease (includes SpoIVFB) [Thermoactinomyces sp. DSM 45891]